MADSTSGVDVVRLLAALATGRGDPVQARSFAVSRWGENCGVVRALSGYISTGDFGDSPDYAAIARGFIETLRADSVIARINTISPMRRTAFNIATLKQVRVVAAAWTAEGLAMEGSDTAFETLRLCPRKITGFVVFTAETLKLTGPELERALLNDLSRAVAEMESVAFVDPANAGDDEKPASVTHAAPVVHSSGPAPDAIRADVRSMLTQFRGDVSRALWLLNSLDAVSLCLMGDAINALGLTATGGMWCGIPAIASESCPVGQITLVDPSGILYADERIELDLTGQALVSVAGEDGEPEQLLLWQRNLRAVKAQRFLSWQVARENAAVYLDGLTFE